MEISPSELRRLAREVDEQHRDELPTLPDRLGELYTGEGARTLASRRSLLRTAALGGAAVTIGAVTVPLTGLMGTAWAQEGSTTTTTEGDATTTTAAGGDTSGTTVPGPTPISAPSTLAPGSSLRSPEVVQLAVFAESVELAAVAAYQLALDSGLLSDQVAEVAAMFQGHHRQHAQLMHGYVGPQAVTLPNQTLVQAVVPQIEAAAGEPDVLEVAYGIEEGAAATYLFALGIPLDPLVAAKLAAILPVESQHAVVLGQVIGKPEADYLPPLQTLDGAFDPAQYPIATPEQLEEVTAP
ncbi:MAG: ferritin-like domain-containing protein [Acidimicrobiales bacterium]|nr:ferritin-like domain-containing protein [Acidimicrobiales bacterium]